MTDGNKMDTPSFITYSNVVSRYLVIICLYNCGPYLTDTCKEKVCIQYGPEFVNLEGGVLVLKKALYGSKYLGASFR